MQKKSPMSCLRTRCDGIVDGKTAEGKFTQDIAAEVERVKQHNETRVEYMTLMMELKQQRREGVSEGKDIMKKALQMLKDKIPDEKVCKETVCSLDEILQLKALVS